MHPDLWRSPRTNKEAHQSLLIEGSYEPSNFFGLAVSSFPQFKRAGSCLLVKSLVRIRDFNALSMLDLCTLSMLYQFSIRRTKRTDPNFLLLQIYALS